LSYCLSQNEIDNVLIGVDSLDHLQNNIENSKTIINYESFKKINEIEIYDKDLINPSLWEKNQKLF
jgi:aryl-alcohol dehydrogenase-like predicted oxidoreductase